VFFAIGWGSALSVSEQYCKTCGKLVKQATEIRFQGVMCVCDPTWVHVKSGCEAARKPYYHKVLVETKT
jgi:hypothetical protein